MLLIHT
ncbi:BgTH12-05395 [Blumeria graminis f. sp. triticale]|nr:BgTH12-05395 [Blumeria graminis f. sp. triticale]